MLKRILALPGITGVFSFLILGLLVWFVGPYIKIGGSAPFASMSVRSLIIALIGGGFLLKLSFSQFSKYGTQVFPLLVSWFKKAWLKTKEFALNFGVYSKRRAINIKNNFSKDKQRRQLRKMPWYLVVGSPQSGKKTLVANSGSHFLRPELFGEEAINYINQFPDYEWWFTEEAILIDSMKYDSETDLTSWKNFVKLLRRQRKNKPLNGIILTFSLPDLLLVSNQKRQDFIQDVCQYIRSIHQVFKAKVPVYLLFNKCDLVDGFMEFFNDMSKEELSQVWGMTLPLDESTDINKVKTFFSRQYNELILRLQKRVLWALDTEKSQRGRELINYFPQQMQLFKQPIETFIAELFGATRYMNALQFRGVYFTSSIQDGKPYDFLLAAMSKKFQLLQSQNERTERVGETYFLQRLFHEVIFPEGKILGNSERSQRLKQWSYNFTRVAAPAVIILSSIGMYNAYKQNKQSIAIVKNDLNTYQQALQQLPASDASIQDTLPVINALHHAQIAYQAHNSNWLKYFMIESNRVGSEISNALQRNLQSLFMPRIAADLEKRLNQQMKNQNLLYATLKGYLAFSPDGKTDSSSIPAPMEYEWSQEFRATPKIKQALTGYLQQALGGDIKKLPVDRSLINRIRVELEEIVPSKRAYGLMTLKAGMSNLPDMLFLSKIGPTFLQVFNDKGSKNYIPGLYTRTGYENVFLKQQDAISQQVAEDNRAIGLEDNSDTTQSQSQIRAQMQMLYTNDYEQKWVKALDQLSIKKFNNIGEAIATINLITSNQSPLNRLLNIVYDNTKSINGGKVTVATNFSAIDEFAKTSNNGVSLNKVMATLNKLSSYLQKIQQSPNPSLVEFNAAKAYMKGGDKNPIRQLSIEAIKAPMPVRKWLTNIADNSWSVIVKGAHQQINAAWQQKVMGEFNSQLHGRYPLDRRASSQISIDDFTHFFGPNGTLVKFFNNYIKPFVNTTMTPWKFYNLNGHNIQISYADLARFETAAHIRATYFPNGSLVPHFKFSIKPRTLNQNARSIDLVYGNKNLVYSHGPQQPLALTWPMSQNAQTVKLLFSNFSGGHASVTTYGPWAWFRMLDKTSIRQTASGDRYVFTIRADGHYASYDILTTNDLGFFKLQGLKGFVLPKDIA